MQKLDICKQIISSVTDMISSPETLEAYRASKFFVRKRKLSMLNVIYFLLYNGKSALQGSISDVRDMLSNVTLYP